MKLRPEDLDAVPAEDLDLLQGHLDRELAPREATLARKLLAANPVYRKLLDLLRGLDVLSRRSPPARAARVEFSSARPQRHSLVGEMPLFGGLQQLSEPPALPGPPADWRSRAAELDPPLRQVPMRVAPQHAVLLDQPFELRCEERVFDQTELEILDEYGRLMQALTMGEVRPHTKDEHRFYLACVANVPPSSDEERVWTKYLRHARAGDAGEQDL